MNELFRALPALLKEFDDNETLREAVTFAAWRKHLENLSGQMIFKINSVLGQAVVTYIEFHIDEKAVERANVQKQTPMLSDEEFEEIALEEVTPKMRRAADAIKDDNLRYQFLLAAGGALARKKKLK